jgi:hypothetical protein
MISLFGDINWQTIAHANLFYKGCDFIPVETPWIVRREISNVTMPSFTVPTSTIVGDLVGSGEQGLLAIADKLGSGKWMTTTPCFRGDVPDQIHGTHFMKVELMILNMSGASVEDVLLNAIDFHKQYLDIAVYGTGINAYDILCKKTGIELGSYGVRKYGRHTWVYGTGVAEPRLSTVSRM